MVTGELPEHHLGTKKELLYCSTLAVYRNIDGYERPVVNEFSEFEMS